MLIDIITRHFLTYLNFIILPNFVRFTAIWKLDLNEKFTLTLKIVKTGVRRSTYFFAKNNITISSCLEATLSLGFTNRSKILHYHLDAKKIYSGWIPRNLTTSRKDGRVDLCKQKRMKYNDADAKDVYIIEAGGRSWSSAKITGN